MECFNERLKGLEARADPVAQQERRLGCQFSPGAAYRDTHWEPPHPEHAHRIRGCGPLDCALVRGHSLSLAVDKEVMSARWRTPTRMKDRLARNAHAVAGSPTGETPGLLAPSDGMAYGSKGGSPCRTYVAQSTVVALDIPSACMM
jgi:hypothetical protein